MVLTIFITYLNAMQGADYGFWAYLGAVAFDILVFGKWTLFKEFNYNSNNLGVK